jgi:hypothetical protein
MWGKVLIYGAMVGTKHQEPGRMKRKGPSSRDIPAHATFKPWSEEEKTNQ